MLTHSQNQKMEKKSPSKYYLGIDPASEGAAILLNENGVVALSFIWRKRTRNKKRIYEMRHYDLDSGKTFMSQINRYSSIGLYIAETVSKLTDNVSLACEDSYFRPNPKATILISRLSGLIVAPIENKFDTDCQWYRAAEWRHKILGLNPFTKRAQAKNASLKLIPKLISNLTMVLHKLGTFDHLTDASGVALLLFKTETNKPLK